MKNMKLGRVISRKSIIKKLAYEIAYLQVGADYWHYIVKNQDIVDNYMERIFEIKDLAYMLGILDEVYEEGYKIYNFKNSGKKDFVPNEYYIRTMYTKIAEPRKKKGLVF